MNIYRQEFFMEMLLLFLFLFILNVLPWVLALMSKKTSGNNKIIWFLISFFLSWLGFIVYYFLAVRPEWKTRMDKSKSPRILRDDNGMPIKMYKQG